MNIECREVAASGATAQCPSCAVPENDAGGTARVLNDLISGQLAPERLGEGEIADALDLCLGCKGCKRGSASLDVSSFKADFHARHFAHTQRPRAAHSLGRIERWARLGSRLPRAANIATQAPLLSSVMKWIGEIARPRVLPLLATKTFRAWHAKHAPRTGGQRVILWPDTFNNYFRPSTAVAATEALERLGFHVDIPKAPLCCGRPLYEWGWIEEAKLLWHKTLNTLREEIEAGTPVIGLEPACISAFRDELPALFPEDPWARKLAHQTRMLSEFLHDRGLVPAVIAGSPRVLVQFHCHHRAVLDADAEKQLLAALPLVPEILQDGCCGMAGSFGFAKTKYDLSRAIGERSILPKIRSAPQDTLIIANGFACRQQIEQATGRTTLHLAELFAAA